MIIWFLIAATFVGAFLLLGTLLALMLERAYRKRWKRRALRAGYMPTTAASSPPRFGNEPAGETKRGERLTTRSPW